MRNARLLTTATLVLTLASTAVACGGGGDSAGPGADGNGKTAVTRLVKVTDMNGVVTVVKSATECQDFGRDKEDIYADIDGHEQDSGASAAQIAATNKAFSIKDRAACYGESANDDVHKMMLIDDMAAFEAAYKKYQRSDGDTHTRYFVGQNFAVQLNGRSDEEEALVRAGTMGINCSPNFVPPAGFRSEPALVDGCVLTDYVG